LGFPVAHWSAAQDSSQPASHVNYTQLTGPNGEPALPASINRSGTVTGGYPDVVYGSHGFLRNKDGLITTIDGPDSLATNPAIINNAGDVSGVYLSQQGGPSDFLYSVFLRTADGTFTIFFGGYDPTVTGMNASDLIVYNTPSDYYTPIPSDAVLLNPKTGVYTDVDVPWTNYDGTFAQGINKSGAIVGNYDAFDINVNIIAYGFLRDPGGNFTSLTVPGASGTTAVAINDSGTIAGDWFDSANNTHAYVRSPDGSFKTFDFPGAVLTSVQSVNDFGAVLGYFQTTVGGPKRCFIRSASGGIVAFEDPSDPSLQLTPTGMNDFRITIGYSGGPNYNLTPAEGFVRTP
jgi:uncharacterized membrane protein